MGFYVYADILFTLNLCVDFAVLRGAGLLLGRRSRRLRVLLGAAFAALAFCVVFCLGAHDALSAASGLVGLTGGVAIGFAPLRARDYLALCLGTLALTAAAGGGCLAVYYALFAPGMKLSPVLDRYPLWLLAPAFLIIYFITATVTSRIRRRELRGASYSPLKIYQNGSHVSVRALLDTGHTLREPISQKPVVIVDFAALKALLPQDALALFEERGERDLVRVMEVFTQNGMGVRLRVIPFRSVGEASGVLVGFRPDAAYIGGEERPAQTVVAVYNGRLSPEGDYDAIVNPEILKYT